MKFAVLALVALAAVAVVSAADVDSRPRTRAQVLKNLVPRSRLNIVPRGTLTEPVKQQMTTQQAVAAIQPVQPVTPVEAVAAATTVLRATANTPGCAAKGGVCGDPNACRGTLARNLCGAGAAVCCVPSSTPTAPVNPPAPAGPLSFSKTYLMGKFEPSTHPDFRAVGGGRYLRKDAYAAYLVLNTACKNEIGVDLTIVSATRNFAAQRDIWQNKWNNDAKYNRIAAGSPRARAIMSYSSMPSTSQHHWGGSLDVWSVEPTQFTGTATGRRLDAWLKANVAKYNFCRPYSPRASRAQGYNEEQWHISWKPVIKAAMSGFRNTITYADITGFSGSESARELGAIENYVYGIDPDCLV